MPKAVLSNHSVALAEATEHLQKLSHVEVELAACQQASQNDSLKLDQLRSDRAAVTDEVEMKNISAKQRAVEASLSDNRDRLETLQNRRKALRIAVPDVNQRFIVAYNALIAKLTAQFRQRYTEFLEEQLRPLIELGNALRVSGEISFVLSGVNANQPDQKSAFVSSGVLRDPTSKPNAEAIAAQEMIQPWSTAAAQLSAIENQLRIDQYKADQEIRTAKKTGWPLFTNADMGGITPTEPERSIPNMELTGKGFAHMYPGVSERQHN